MSEMSLLNMRAQYGFAGAASGSVSTFGLSTEMKQLSKQLPSVLSNSRAESTVAKYCGAWLKWAEWAEVQKVSSLPANLFRNVARCVITCSLSC